MPKEENLTGDQVVALTKKYLSPEDVAFVQKAMFYAVVVTMANSVSLVSPISFTRFKWQESLLS